MSCGSNSIPRPAASKPAVVPRWSFRPGRTTAKWDLLSSAPSRLASKAIRSRSNSRQGLKQEGRFSAIRSRAWIGVPDVLPVWDPFRTRSCTKSRLGYLCWSLHQNEARSPPLAADGGQSDHGPTRLKRRVDMTSEVKRSRQRSSYISALFLFCRRHPGQRRGGASHIDGGSC